MQLEKHAAVNKPTAACSNTSTQGLTIGSCTVYTVWLLVCSSYYLRLSSCIN